MTKIEALGERLDAIDRQIETGSRRGPSPWFGFRSAYPVHSYDPPNARFDLTNMNAWEWFCYLQMTPIELDECMAISVWNSDNGYPLVVYGALPDLRSQAEALNCRRQELEVLAQGRAEELDRKDAEAWPRWKEFYKQLGQDEKQDHETSDEPVEVADDTPGKGIRLMWAWRFNVLELYRKFEKEQLESGVSE